MVHDSDRLHRLLAALQDTSTCVGFEALARKSKFGNRRTLYRLRAWFGPRLQVIPSFTLEGLGLCHLHLFVADPAEAFLRFPYAVEHAWLSPDYVHNQLYLHCIVPQEHRAFVTALLREFRSSCAGMSMAWSDDGWQEIPGITPESTGMLPGQGQQELLAKHPLVVPVAMEAWRGKSMSRTWDCIKGRVNTLRAYLTRGRIYATNGKWHVRQAYERLSHVGLFRQYLIRYQAWADEPVDLLIVLAHADEWLPELIEALRPVASVIETYTNESGDAIVRTAGSIEIRTILQCAQDDLRRYGARVFGYNPQHPQTGEVRFCYEFLFDPTTGCWVFPRERIVQHMRGDV